MLLTLICQQTSLVSSLRVITGRARSVRVAGARDFSRARQSGIEGYKVRAGWFRRRHSRRGAIQQGLQPPGSFA
jgi:hypothetical protein